MGPSRAFAKRDFHRRWLTLHFSVWMLLLVAAFLVNRSWTPETFWLPWVMVPAGIALGVHGAVFARSTLSTMGGK
jgi:hypothetical protein